MAARALITIRVHPGASRAKVAAEAGGAAEAKDAGTGGQNQVLGVWVHERAVGGQATEAALTAVATAVGVRRSAVRLVAGARSRLKIVEITDPPAGLAQRLSGTGPDRRRRRS